MEKLVIPGLTEDHIASLYNTKAYDQYVTMVDNFLKGHCPFCQINTKINTVLYQNGSWKIWVNPYPHAHQQLHLIIPHHRHLKNLSDMTAADWDGIGDIVSWATLNFDLPGGAIALRFGNPKLHAGSVPGHLHWNIQIPTGQGPVSVILAKSKEDIATQEEQLLIYEKIRTGIQHEDLSEEEKKKIHGRYPTLELH